MNPQEYRGFTARLVATLAARPEVLGVVAVGSMAEQTILPDEWSDHDFFVVVAAGTQERLRDDLSWLPDAGRVVLAFRETEHGLKALYDDGHLVEFAVFSPDELALARVNRHRVLLDHCDVAGRMAAVRNMSARLSRESYSDDRYLIGQLLIALLVGVGRHRRGEHASGHALVKGAAFTHLARLLARHVPPTRPDLLDDLDPLRRLELAYPALARELDAALQAPVPDAARILLALARREIARLQNAFPAAADLVQRLLSAS